MPCLTGYTLRCTAVFTAGIACNAALSVFLSFPIKNSASVPGPACVPVHKS